MTMSSFSSKAVKERSKNSDADVRLELTRMIFEGVTPQILIGGLGIVTATSVMAAHFDDPVLGWLAAAAATTCSIRLLLAYRFGARRERLLDERAALLWEAWYGSFTIAYAVFISWITLYNFRYHDSSAQGWCAMGIFAIASGISAGTSLRPWIAQVSGVMMLVALSYAVLRSDLLLVRCSASSVIAYIYYYWKSVHTRHQSEVERIRVNRQLIDMAQHDSLTGLANRRHFESRLAVACRQSCDFGLFYIDLDKFKGVNDSIGHGAGDELLRVVAVRLRMAVRGTDLVARIGGDEFAVLLFDSVTEDFAQSLATRINYDMAQSFEVEGHQIHIGASIGIRLAKEGERDAAALLKHADNALYQVKRGGGGGFSFAEQSSFTQLHAAS